MPVTQPPSSPPSKPITPAPLPSLRVLCTELEQRLRQQAQAAGNPPTGPILRLELSLGRQLHRLYLPLSLAVPLARELRHHLRKARPAAGWWLLLANASTGAQHLLASGGAAGTRPGPLRARPTRATGPGKSPRHPAQLQSKPHKSALGSAKALPDSARPFSWLRDAAAHPSDYTSRYLEPRWGRIAQRSKNTGFFRLMLEEEV